MLGKAILPPTGFGNKSSQEKESIPKQKRRFSAKASVSVERVNIINECLVEVQVSGRIPKDKDCRVKILVETQESRLDKEKWQLDFPNIDFPFEITSIENIEGSFMNEYDVSLDNGELVFKRFDNDRTFTLFVRVKKNTNQYAPLIVINS